MIAGKACVAAAAVVLLRNCDTDGLLRGWWAASRVGRDQGSSNVCGWRLLTCAGQRGVCGTSGLFVVAVVVTLARLYMQLECVT